MISIAMATYNGEKYLEEQLESIAKQTIQPDELVVCDDCSTDKTIEILENFKNRVNFDVRILQNDVNSGYVKNFARVISEAKGDFVFMCDQDDCWFPNKIEVVLKTFEENPNAQLVAHNAICTDSDLKPLGKTLFEFDVSRGLRYGSAIHGFVTCVRRSYLDYMLPIPYCYSFDRWLSLPASELKVRYELDTVLGYYRRHENAITFDTIGKSQNIINIAKRKIKSNIRSIKRARSMEEIDYRYTRETSIVEFARRVRANKELPAWINEELLNKLESSAKIKVEAFKVRYNAISVTGLERLQRILRAYKKGIYKNFHGFQTALDDLFRFTGDFRGLKEQEI